MYHLIGSSQRSEGGILLPLFFKWGPWGPGRCLPPSLCVVGLAFASGFVRIGHPDIDISFNSPLHTDPQTGEAEKRSSVWLWTFILCLSIKESLAQSWLSAWRQPQCKNSGGMNLGNRDAWRVYRRSSSRDEQTVLLRFSPPSHPPHAAEYEYDKAIFPGLKPFTNFPLSTG